MSTEVTTAEQGELEETPRIIAEAQATEVQTPEQAQLATEFLSQIAAIKRQDESARKTLVKPLNDHVKMINDRFKRRSVPLDEADQIVRGKVLAYETEQQRLRAQEQARLDRERREAEAKAEAERKAAVEAQQKAEREAREAEERRAAERSAAENARRAEIAEMDDQSLIALAAGVKDGDETPDALMAAQELNAREGARKAQEAAAQAERRAEEARQREIAAKSAPAAVATQAPLQSQSGKANTRKRWVAEVIDIEQVPRQYLVVDQAALNAAVRSGVREIPGVKIEQKTELSVRSR